MKEIKQPNSLRKIQQWVIVLLFSAAILAACDSDKVDSTVGIMHLSLSADTTSLSTGIQAQTKAISPDELADFLVTKDYRIYIKQNNDTIIQYNRYDQMPDEIALEEGLYTLIAAKGEDKPVAFSNPYFEGEVDFRIKDEMSTAVKVTTTLANARLTYDVTEDLQEAYSDYTLLIGTSHMTEFFEISKEETRPAYLQVPKDGIEMQIGIRLKKVTSNEYKTYKLPSTVTLKRRQNVHLLFKTDGEALDGVGIEILLDNEMVEYPFPVEIPNFMWQQFSNPILEPVNFSHTVATVIDPATDEVYPSVGFQAAAGIAQFDIDIWEGDGVLFDDAENVQHYNLATEEGAAAAKTVGISWNLENEVLKGVKSSGQLNLKTLLKNIPAGACYNIRFLIVDQLDPAKTSEELLLVVKMKGV